MKQFFKAIEPYSSLTRESKNKLGGVLKIQELPKGHMLVRHNTTCNHIFYVENGLARTYYYKNGRDVTDWFSYENTFSCSILSYLSRKSDKKGIELLEDSTLISMHYDEVEQLCKEYHDIENFVRRVTNLGLMMVQNKFDSFIFETAEQRYKKFSKVCPHLLQRVSLGQIASFLGVTQETLSRIRASQ